MADARDFESLESVGEVAWKTHDQPDAGLWEFRTRQLVHTYSAVMSWAACDRLANVAARIGRPEREAHWNKRAAARSEEHTSELQSLMRISYAALCLKKKHSTTHR